MKAYPDTTAAVDERSTERMSFRTKPRIKEAIHHAAALSGLDDSTFAMSAAYKAALETIKEHEHTTLHAVDHKAFFEALDNPPAPTDKLRTAFARHAATIRSK